MSQTELLGIAREAKRSALTGTLIRTVSIRGFGGANRSGELLVVTKDRADGEILGRAFSSRVTSATRERIQLATTRRLSSIDQVVEFDIDDSEAVAGGLACGGVARLIIQDLASIPAEFLDLAVSRVPVALLTSIGGGASFPSAVIDSMSSLAELVSEEELGQAAKVFGGGRSGVVVLEEGRKLFESFAPRPKLISLGEGKLAIALEQFCRLLGFTFVTGLGGEGVEEELALLGPLDAVIVLSHDHDLVTAPLAELLKRSASGAGNGEVQTYVGSLGSRHTQAVRRQRLHDAGVSEEMMRSLYGPVGLDIGSISIEETAMAILAEFIAHRQGRSGGHLRDALGPING